jgi:hypothetical protein
MGIISRIRDLFTAGKTASPQITTTLTIAPDRHDQPEQRDPATFPRLAEVMRLVRTDPALCLKLCREQINETPDYDVAYIWASNIEDSAGDVRAALETLQRGMSQCKRVSALLEKQGECYLASKDVVRMTLAFGQAILAQEPPRSQHAAYLYFGYICLFGDYGNAGNKAIAIARAIDRRRIDLTYDTQVEIRQTVAPNQQRLDSMLRSFIQLMLQENRID